jgi:hypothetical protein
MIRIDRRTVELTPDEVAISETFDLYLDRGLGIHAAVYHARIDAAVSGITLSNEFWEYLGS